MERVNSFLGQHLWVQVLLSLPLAFAIVLLLFPGRSAASALLYVMFSAIGGIGVLLAVRRREKRAAGGSVDGLVSLDRKLRRGEVPTAPQERQAMRDLVEDRLHRGRHRGAAQVGLAVMFCAVVVATALNREPAADPRHGPVHRGRPRLARPAREPAAPATARHARGTHRRVRRSRRGRPAAAGDCPGPPAVSPGTTHHTRRTHPRSRPSPRDSPRPSADSPPRPPTTARNPRQ